MNHKSNISEQDLVNRYPETAALLTQWALDAAIWCTDRADWSDIVAMLESPAAPMEMGAAEHVIARLAVR